MLVCLVLVTSACETARPSPTATSEATPTQPPAAHVVVPTMIQVPTSPPPAFSPSGPFLAFANGWDYQPKNITLFDPLQQSRLVISRPAGDVLQWNASGLSPDGQYMAYFSGNLDPYSDPANDPETPKHIELNIMRTLDGSLVFQTSLLNKDYPQIFLETADRFLANPPADFNWTFADFEPYRQSYSDLPADQRYTTAYALELAFLASIYEFSWSPDGHTLAYASGAGGPASDIYTYNINTGLVTRITNGPSDVFELHWSPDGKWILNNGTYSRMSGPCRTWYLSAADGSGLSGFSIQGAVNAHANSVKNHSCHYSGWISDHQALLFESEPGTGDYNLEILDIHQKTIELLWPHQIDTFSLAFDPVGQQLYISTPGETQEDGSYFPQGTYRVDVATHRTEPVYKYMDRLIYLGWSPDQIVLGFTPDFPPSYCYLPSKDCTRLAATALNPYSGSVSVSGKNLIMFSDPGLRLYSQGSEGSSALIADTEGFVNVYWCPNPDRDPAKDLALFETSYQSIYRLFNPTTGILSSLSDFKGSSFLGCYWRK
jgi:WD40 repeat protein